MATTTKIAPTKNPLPEEMKSQLVNLLNERLAELIDLQLQAKQAHWNYKGPNFIGVHEMLDKLAEDAADYADLVAERAVQLGGIANGTVQAVVEHSPLDNYPARPILWKEHILFLSTALARVSDNITTALDAADDLGDALTVDIFTEIGRGIDVWLWKVEAHGE